MRNYRDNWFNVGAVLAMAIAGALALSHRRLSRSRLNPILPVICKLVRLSLCRRGFSFLVHKVQDLASVLSSKVSSKEGLSATAATEAAPAHGASVQAGGRPSRRTGRRVG